MKPYLFPHSGSPTHTHTHKKHSLHSKKENLSQDSNLQSVILKAAHIWMQG